MRKSFRTPELLVDDHHGVYMMNLLVKCEKQFRGRIYHEMEKWMNPFYLKALLDGPDSEEYWDACDRVCNMTFTTRSGGKFIIAYVEGGLWAVPHCFRGMAREEFFGA